MCLSVSGGTAMNNGDVNVSETSQTEVLADSNSIIKEKETEICEKCGFELREEQELTTNYDDEVELLDVEYDYFEE